MMNAQAGIVISASHNPYRDNGIKIFTSQGTKLPDEIELEIEQRLEKTELTMATQRLGKVFLFQMQPINIFHIAKVFFRADLH